MLVFWKERLAILAVPKTGTTALEGVLAPRASMVLRDPPEVKHVPLYRYRRFLEPFIEAAAGGRMETLAVVRHPVDRLSSWYRYRSRDALVGQPNSTRGVTFDEFVLESLKGKPAPFAALGSQARFLRDVEGGPGLTHAFRYEEPGRLLAFLEERLGMTVELPRLNVSPAMDVELDPGVEARLRDRRADEFAVWEAAGR